MLPQRSLNQSLVDKYFADYPALAPLFDRVGFFDVFATPWFAAIYLLLMVSLVGCVLPRAWEHASGCARRPVADPAQPRPAAPPRRARRSTPPSTRSRQRSRARLKGWRRAEVTEDGVLSVSAEKGYLREAGNLVFHLSLIGLLLGFAAASCTATRAR